VIKIVLDTNVLMSAVYWGGYPGQVLDTWHEGGIKLVISSDIINEYSRIGDSLSKKYPGTDISRLIELITIKSELVASKPRP